MPRFNQMPVDANGPPDNRRPAAPGFDREAMPVAGYEMIAMLLRHGWSSIDSGDDLARLRSPNGHLILRVLEAGASREMVVLPAASENERARPVHSPVVAAPCVSVHRAEHECDCDSEYGDYACGCGQVSQHYPVPISWLRARLDDDPNPVLIAYLVQLDLPTSNDPAELIAGQALTPCCYTSASPCGHDQLEGAPCDCGAAFCDDCGTEYYRE